MKNISIIISLLISFVNAKNMTDCHKPPVSNGWSFDCNRFLRISCTKCYNECGGDYPTLFPDSYCERCIPYCYNDDD